MAQNLERLAKNLVDTNDENRFYHILDEFLSVFSTLTNEGKIAAIKRSNKRHSPKRLTLTD